MNLQDFTYDLPEHLIAQNPLHRRDRARLMVIERSTGKIRHDIFANLSDYLPEKSLLVLNDSKVIPARLLGQRASGGAVEIFLLKELRDGYSFEALIHPLRRLKEGEQIFFKNNGSIIAAQIKNKEQRIVRFNKKNIVRHLDEIGHIPLPPYIKRRDRAEDRRYYQTVFARSPGSVASPTAGLHFTKRLLKKIEKEGHTVARVTLHVNYATFKPVEEADITRHAMHEEEYVVPRKAQGLLQKARRMNEKIVVIGTTSCRVLESWAGTGQQNGWTDIFIYPGYAFRLTDILVTNFHQPFSTLLMLVYAFGGKDLMKRAYAEAVRRRYRFFSYGDAMIIV